MNEHGQVLHFALSVSWVGWEMSTQKYLQFDSLQTNIQLVWKNPYKKYKKQKE